MADAADTSRIEQFRKMAEADPANELGHFSLGREYLAAGMHAEAAASLKRAIELNPNISKAYQLLAEAQVKLGQRDDAVGTLTRGATVAAERGDRMPMTAMVEMLRQLGAPVPERATAASGPAAPLAVGEGELLCARCQQVRPRLPDPPFRGDQGRMIFERICAPCWREWIGMGTKVINELRLPLSDPQAQKVYDQHMLEFLNLK